MAGKAVQELKFYRQTIQTNYWQLLAICPAKLGLQTWAAVFAEEVFADAQSHDARHDAHPFFVSLC